MSTLKFTVLFLFAFAQAMSGQSFLASITRTVLDPSGAVVPQAKVIVLETQRSIQHQAVTNASGVYTFSDLIPGTYSITISAPGFKDVTSGNIILTAQQVQQFDVNFEMGSSSTAVEVAATAPTINTDNAEISGVGTRRELTLLPTNQRSTITLFMLS